MQFINQDVTPYNLVIRNEIGLLWNIPEHHQGIMKEGCKVQGIRFTVYWIVSFLDLKPYTLLLNGALMVIRVAPP